MKYLVKELYTKCFYGDKYNNNQDKFVVGYKNHIGNKLKDVITGQIVEADYFETLSDMVIHHMTLGYMTGLDSNSATIKQQILARYIDKTILKNDILDSKQIAKINYDKISVLIIENSNKDYVEYQYVIKDTNIKLKLISHKTILEDIEQGKIHILEYQSITSPIIKDIAVARLILHEYLYLTTSQDSVIWILDEDMELKELVYKNHQLSELDIDIIKIISKYKSFSIIISSKEEKKLIIWV